MAGYGFRFPVLGTDSVSPSTPEVDGYGKEPWSTELISSVMLKPPSGIAPEISVQPSRNDSCLNRNIWRC